MVTYSASHPDQSAGTRVALFQLISVASLARIGNQSPCPLQITKRFAVTPRVSHIHTGHPAMGGKQESMLEGIDDVRCSNGSLASCDQPH